MLEFDDFVFLEVQKTGSTYVRQFLKSFAHSRLLLDDKHAPIKHHNNQKIYIITCRDPLRQYLSLYCYGCRGKGSIHRSLSRGGMGYLYDRSLSGFSNWLELIAEPSSRGLYLRNRDDHPVLDLVGVLSFRFLRLAVPSYLELFESINDEKSLKLMFDEHKIYDILLRTETLNFDLAALATGEHSGILSEPAAALEWLETPREVNVSPDLGIDIAELSSDILSLVQRREWFFFERLQYERYI